MSSERTGARLWVALIWGDTVLAERVFRPGAPVYAGTTSRNDLVLPVEAGLGERHALFVPEAGDYVLEPGGGRPARAVSSGGRGLISLGPVQVYFDYSPVVARVPRRPFWAGLEPQTLASFNAAVVLHLGVLVAAFLLWDEAPALTTLSSAPREVRVSFERPRPPVDDPVEAAAAPPGEEGTVGDPERDRPTKVPRKDGPQVDRLRRGRDTGALAVLNSALAARGPLGHALGNDDLSGKLDAAMAGTGDELVVGRGAGGLGLRGLGNGGGGGSIGSIQAIGPPGVPASGRRTRARLKRPRPRRAPRVGVSLRPALTGFCRESDIRRVVRERSRGVTYCYEKALLREPELAGKLTLRWMIALDGRVSRVFVEGNTLGDRAVASCVRRAVARWRFPRPEGGQCVVRFPFVFSPGG